MAKSGSIHGDGNEFDTLTMQSGRYSRWRLGSIVRERVSALLQRRLLPFLLCTK